MLDCIEAICPKGGVKGTISSPNHQTTIIVSLVIIVSIFSITSIVSIVSYIRIISIISIVSIVSMSDFVNPVSPVFLFSLRLTKPPLILPSCHPISYLGANILQG